MKNKTQGASKEGTVVKSLERPKRTNGTLAFLLVVIMLVILLGLVITLVVIVGNSANNTNIDKLIDYSKWVLSALLGVFGAWIGAGAAYFFGKENLMESSASTEAALRIQQDVLQGTVKPECVKELTLTTINKDFMFNPADTKGQVIEKLNHYKDYWWVPVLGSQGILDDILHARVIWDTTFAENDPLSKIITDINMNQDLKERFGKLHGACFFIKVTLEDKIADVAAKMNKSDATVGVVVDDIGRPTYCFTKQNILSAQR